MAVSYVVIQAMKHGHLPILLPLPVLVGIFILTVMMCLWSSILSIFKVTRIDPALVFKS
jgi:putative ABC transport system permease protein